MQRSAATTHPLPASRPQVRVPRIGELLVAQGVLRQSEVDAVLERQQTQDRPFGVLCEEMFGIDPTIIEGAWTDQYRALAHTFDADFTRVDAAAAALVTARQAWQFRFFPLRFEHGAVVAATTPAHLARACRFASSVLGLPAIFVVVDSHELSSALETHYPMDGFDVRTVQSLHGVNGNTRT